MGAIGALALISHTHGPKRTPRNRNLLSGATVTREARTLTGVTGCGIGNMDFQLDAVKEQVSQVRHHPDGAAGQGTPTSGRHSGPQGRGRFLAVRLHGGRHGARSAANGVCHSSVRITANAGIPAEKGPSRNWGSFPPPAFGGLCRPEVGVPLPVRHSAWWHGRHAPRSASARRPLGHGERSQV